MNDRLIGSFTTRHKIGLSYQAGKLPVTPVRTVLRLAQPTGTVSVSRKTAESPRGTPTVGLKVGVT